MQKLNDFAKYGVLGLALAVGSSLLTLAPSVAIAPSHRLAAQLNPNPSIFNEPPFNRVPRPGQSAPTSPTTPPPSSTDQQQPPDTAIAPVNGAITIRFVNETGAVIDYEVIGQTEPRTLAGRSEIMLRDLTVPTTFTFRRQDKGFLLVTLQENNPTAGTLTLSVQETADFAADRTSVYIDPTGNVFLN
jgi:hypothetical protein